MLLRELDKRRENDGGRGAGGVEIAILYGGVDAGVRGVLHSLQYRKEPSEDIRQIFAFFSLFSSDFLTFSTLRRSFAECAKCGVKYADF